MKLVVAVDKEWGIGYNGNLLANVRADLRNFRNLTKDNVVILGSKTLSTFPEGKILKNRINIVLSRNPDFAPEGAIMARSIDELLEIIKEYDNDKIFVIGGSQIYSALLPYCDTAIVTKFDKSFQKDAFFPNLDEDDNWELTEIGEEQTTNPETDTEKDMTFRFCTYNRKKV